MSFQDRNLFSINSGKLTGAVALGCFVDPTGLTMATAAGDSLGVARMAGAVNDIIPVMTHGIAPVLSSGTIAVGDLIEVGAAGVGIKKASGIARARALEAANNDGSTIMALLLNT